MNSKSAFFIMLVLLCMLALRLYSNRRSPSENHDENLVVDPPRIPAIRTKTKETAVSPPPRTQISPGPTLSPTNTGAGLSASTLETISPSANTVSTNLSMNQKFASSFMKGDLEQKLRSAQRLAPGSAVDTALATRSAFLVKTTDHEIKALVSFDTNTTEGCVSIRESSPIRGSLLDSSMELYRLPENHAYAAIIRKTALVVIYADIEKWGQQRKDEEPRLLLYYRKRMDGKWQYQGDGVDNFPVNSSPSQTSDEYCDLP